MNDEIRNRFRGVGSRPVGPVGRGPAPLRPAQARPRPVAPQPAPQPIFTSAPSPKPQSPRPVPPVPARLGYAVHTPGKPVSKKKKRSGRKKVLISLVVLLIVGAGVGAYLIRNRNGGGLSAYQLGSGEKTPAPGNGVPNGTIETERDKAAVSGTIRLVATGDMIAHDSVNANAKVADGSYDYAKLMGNMKDYFSKADIRFCNQATPAGGESFGITGYPVFNAPLAFSRGIESVGCNVINIGTNHTNDKGQPLIDATVAAWDNREGVLAVAGANRSVSEQNQAHVFTVKGVKVAFLSYTTYSNNTSLTPYGVNMYSDALATAQVAEARKNADVVLVSMRWGTEYSPEINATQDQIAQKLSNLGADVIVGHGPHVLQPVKKLKSADGARETVVWYSLGNFLNTQLETEALIGGFAAMEIDAATKKITSIKFMPVYMHYEWTAAEKAANKLLARRNLTMVPLDQASDLLAKSLLNTTVPAQTDRIKAILNKFTEVKIITSSEY